MKIIQDGPHCIVIEHIVSVQKKIRSGYVEALYINLAGGKTHYTENREFIDFVIMIIEDKTIGKFDYASNI